MADEEKQVESTPQEEKPVAEAVTDADLSSAYDSDQQTQTEVKEEVKEPTEPEPVKEEVKEEEKAEEHQEELPEEPADNADRSRLGRNVKETKAKLTEVESKLDALLEKLGAQSPPAQQTQKDVTYNDNYIQTQIEAAVERGELPATIVTPQDQYVVNKFVSGLQNYMGNQYAVQYINTLKSPTLKGGTPDDIHAEVVAELQKVESPFNLRRYDNPKIDAQVNYLEAKAAILEKKFTEKPASVFKGKPKDAPPTGTSVTTKMAVVADEMPPLDAASLEFIKREGMSPESVAAALKGSMPLHLGGRGSR